MDLSFEKEEAAVYSGPYKVPLAMRGLLHYFILMAKYYWGKI